MEQNIVTHQPSLSGSMFQEDDDGFSTESDTNWRSNDAPYANGVALTQPGTGITQTTVTTITQTGGDWSSGLFDIFEDKFTCIFGALAPCCWDLNLAHQYGESLCYPLLPGSTFGMRVALRERYKIKGNMCDDWIAVCCCYTLAVSQMVREMKRRTVTRTYHVSTALVCS
ncbi:PLAC8-like protein 1 isoform X1 [Stigmatopora argus]